MSTGWTPPPPPPPPPPPHQWPQAPPPHPRRYATAGIWIGIITGIVVTIGLSAAGVGAGVAVRNGVVGTVLFVIGGLAPLVLGTILTARHGTPMRRGLGLGLIIGWALAPIVYAGVCFVIIIGAYSQTGS